MFDLHTHSLFSDGELLPSELVRRAEILELKAIALTDHADDSNLEFILPRIVKVSGRLNRVKKIKTIPGIELTHVPPVMIKELVTAARRLGALIVVVHGETISEPVERGTNMAAIDAGVDILAHPGLLSEKECLLSARKGVLLEISARVGHCLTNGHVLNLARKTGARVVINSDAHSPEDLLSPVMIRKIASGAGMTLKEYRATLDNIKRFIKTLRLRF